MKINTNHCTVQLVALGQNHYYNCTSPEQAKFLAGLMGQVHDAGYIEGRNDTPQWKWGWLRNKHSTWIGVHYSPRSKRWCINLIPCFTLWITKPGGNTP